MVGEREILCIEYPANVMTIIYSEGNEYYCIESTRRLDLAELDVHPGIHVPKRSLFPKASDAFPPFGTLATLPLVRATSLQLHPPAHTDELIQNFNHDPASFLKSAGITLYESANPASSLAMTTHLLAHEVATLESLRHHPHPNIVEYRGCVVKDGLVEGIVFEGYPEQLSDVADKVDHAMVLRDIGSAVEHLHSLVLVHVRDSPSFRDDLTKAHFHYPRWVRTT